MKVSQIKKILQAMMVLSSVLNLEHDSQYNWKLKRTVPEPNHLMNGINKINRSQVISIYHPFRYRFPLDPRHISTAGDQILSEHLFMFHSKESIRGGFQAVFSDIEFDKINKTISIKPRYPLKHSNGDIFAFANLCNAITSCFQGTQNAPYRNLFISAECKNDRVVIHLKKIPVNMRFLFTIPDFSVFNQNFLPIQTSGVFPTTGPYSLEKVISDSGNFPEIWLRRNPHFPLELTANQKDKVVLKTYNPSNLDNFIESLNPKNDHLLYFYGHGFSNEIADQLKVKGYQLHYFPSEWLTYIGFRNNVNKHDRDVIGQIIDEARETLIQSSSLGQSAFSIAPSDRPYGVNKEEYFKINKSRSKISDKYLTKPLHFGALDIWKNIPIFKNTIKLLTNHFPSLKINYYSIKDYLEFRNQSDIYLELLGISPADPLSHLSYLLADDPSFSTLISENKISKLAQLDVGDVFINEVKNIESAIVSKRVIVPIGHFPGVVVEAPQFERDETLAWSWGTQAWTYRIR